MRDQRRQKGHESRLDKMAAVENKRSFVGMVGRARVEDILKSVGLSGKDFGSGEGHIGL